MIYTILDADGFVVRDLDGPEGAIDHVPRPDGGSVVSGESEAAGAARIATARRNARDSIDTAAGMARARYITIAPGQDATYAAKYADAAAYAAAGYPADTSNYPWIEAEASQTGLTPDAAAFRIKTTGDFGEGSRVRRSRPCASPERTHCRAWKQRSRSTRTAPAVVNQLNSL